MTFPSKAIVERVKTKSPVGTEGEVLGVDDTILVRLANGSGLNVVYGEDYQSPCSGSMWRRGESQRRSLRRSRRSRTNHLVSSFIPW